MSSSADETLTEAIRKYPVIYDKGRKGHKDKNMVENAWEKVIEECELEDVACAKRLFANLKKRYNKRRKDAKKPSGTGAADVSTAKAKLKEMDYLAWLEPFVVLRATTTNCPNFKSIALNIDSQGVSDDTDDSDESSDEIPEMNVNVAIDNDNEIEDNEENDSTYNTDVVPSVPAVVPPTGEKTLEQDDLLLKTRKQFPSLKRSNSRGSATKQKLSKLSETTGRQKWHQKAPTIEEAQINFFKTAEKVMKTNEQPAEKVTSNKENVDNDGNHHFAKFIAAELAQLPAKFQRIARHEITNTLYNVQNRADEHQEYVPSRYNQTQYAQTRSNHQPYVQGPTDQQQYVQGQQIYVQTDRAEQQYQFNQRYKNLDQHHGDPSHSFQNMSFQNIRMPHTPRRDGINNPINVLMQSISPQVSPRHERALGHLSPRQLSGFTNSPSVQDASEESCSRLSHTNSTSVVNSSVLHSPEFLPGLDM